MLLPSRYRSHRIVGVLEIGKRRIRQHPVNVVLYFLQALISDIVIVTKIGLLPIRISDLAQTIRGGKGQEDGMVGSQGALDRAP